MLFVCRVHVFACLLFCRFVRAILYIAYYKRWIRTVLKNHTHVYRHQFRKTASDDVTDNWPRHFTYFSQFSHSLSLSYLFKNHEQEISLVTNFFRNINKINWYKLDTFYIRRGIWNELVSTCNKHASLLRDLIIINEFYESIVAIFDELQSIYNLNQLLLIAFNANPWKVDWLEPFKCISSNNRWLYRAN